MKRLILTAAILCSLSTHLSAMEQRWQADYSAPERAKNLPKFPFRMVIEHSRPLPGLTMQTSVKETARHLIRYAQTIHQDRSKANFLLAYLKLACEKTEGILARSTYQVSANPMERLFKDLERFHQEIVALENVDQRLKSHASIWLAQFIMKWEETRGAHLQQQENYLRAYGLLVDAHNKKATDVCLLFMAKLFTHHKLRVQKNQLDQIVEITDGDAHDLAKRALDEIGSRYLSRQQDLMRALQHHRQEPKPEDISMADDAEEVVEFKEAHVPFMNTREQKDLYNQLLLELAQPPVAFIEVKGPEQHPVPAADDMEFDDATELVQTLVVPVEITDVPEKRSDSRKSDRAGRISEDYSKQIETIVLRLNLVGKELSKKEWEKYAQTIFQETGHSFAGVRQAIQLVRRDNLTPFGYGDVYLNLQSAAERLYISERKKRGVISPLQKTLLQSIDSLDIQGNLSKEEWADLARALLDNGKIKAHTMELRLRGLSNNINLSDQQRDYCLNLSRACGRLQQVAQRASEPKLKRKRDVESSLELEQMIEKGTSERETKWQRTDE